MSRLHLDRISLRKQIRFFITALICCLTVALAVGLGAYGSVTLRKMIARDLEAVAGAMADKLDRGMFERHREIGIIAGLGHAGIISFAEPAEIREVLERLQSTYPDYAWIGFADGAGRVVAATGGLLEGVVVRERPWYAGARSKPFVGDLHEALLLQRLLAAEGDEPLRFVDVSYPVTAPGGVSGVLGAHLSWSWAEEVRQSVLNSVPAEAGIEILVLDAQGRVILTAGADVFGAQVAPRQNFDGASAGSFVAGDTTGRSQLIGFARAVGYRDYPGLGWIVIARQPLHAALAPIYQMMAIAAAISIVIGLAGLILARIMVTRLTRPLWRLTAAARKLSNDNQIAMLPRVGGSRETSELSQALRALLRRLSDARDDLDRSEKETAAQTRSLTERLEALRMLAEIDPMTQVLNRRAFFERAEVAEAYANRYGHPLSVVALDIDHFKQVNDRFGHAAGDAVIIVVAQAIERARRRHDLAARFGGEEFVVLLMESSAEAAEAFAERLREEVEALALPQLRGERVTISLGCSGVRSEPGAIAAAIDRADTALYEAKRAGRNRVRLAAADMLVLSPA